MDPMERRSQAARSQAAREQITQAALTVFALKGFAAASMEDICLAAGCSKGGLYHHFRSKSEILGAVIDLLADRAALTAPFGDAAIGRVVLETWAEASRDSVLRERLHRATAASGRATSALLEAVRIGVLIQTLTRYDNAETSDPLRCLGIERAA